MSTSTTFQGIPADGLAFLRELSEHNEAAFFESNKQQFVAFCADHLGSLAPVHRWLVRALGGHARAIPAA